MPHKILLVDDDKNITEILEFNLRNEGFEIETVYSAEEALNKSIQQFNLILLDVMMGGMSGYKFAEYLRKNNCHIPIIFLTAKDTENDLLTGFSVGGDDYISKPFSIKEVIARIKAVINRMEHKTSVEIPENNLALGVLTIDLNLKEVFINHEKIALTKTEFALLTLFAQKPNTLFSREKIIDIVWEESPYITARTVDVHLVRLRKKLGKYSDLITSRSGFGYKFNTDIL